MATPAVQAARGMKSIKTRILTILGLLACGYALLLGLVQFTAATTHRHMLAVSSSLFPAALRLNQAEAAFGRLEEHYKEAVLLEDASTIDGAETDATAVSDALASLQTLCAGTPELAASAASLTTEFASIRSRSNSLYGKIIASKANMPDSLQQQAGQLARDDRKFTADMGALDGAVSDQFRERLSLTALWAQRASDAGWVMLVIAAIGGTGTWIVLGLQVFDPLARLAARMQAIAQGDGDLTERVEVHGRNELDEVGIWFNVFIERVEQIVVGVAGNARMLSDAARTLSETARATARQTALQQEQATRITHSMNDIAMASQEISRTTQVAAADSRQAETKAHAGGRTIHATVNTIQQLLGANQATSRKIEELGDASQAIGKIVQVIDDIANQTQLLALNASIESARAGEHGRGFAIVAGEVRRLAERTGAATREIDTSVRAIQNGTTEVVHAMRASLVHVESGVTSARLAGEALNAIILGSESMQTMVTQIASSSSEQSLATESVTDNLNEINEIGMRTASSSARAVDACDRLAALAGDLNKLVGAFKVRAA